MPFRSRQWGRLGYRGGFLLPMGVIYLILGWSSLTSPQSPQSVQGFLEQLLPGPDWILPWLWLLAGALACVCAWFRKPKQDAPGFVALVTVPALWMTGSLLAIFHFDDWRFLYSTGIYACLAVASMRVAGYPEQVRGS